MKTTVLSATSLVFALSFVAYGCSSDAGDTNYEPLIGAGGSGLGGGAPGGGAPPAGTAGTTPVGSAGYVPVTGAGGAPAAGTGGNASPGGSVSAGGAPAGGATGGGGVSPASGGAGPGSGGSGPAVTPPCITNQKQVVIIGDSYVTGAASPALQPALAAIDPNASQYRNYAVAGSAIASGGISKIPPQWDQALAAGKDIKFVIMDGGGNDVLICDQIAHPGCNVCNQAGAPQQKVCQDIVAAAIDGVITLIGKMGDAGVKDVVWFYYPHTPSSDPSILDYAEPIAKQKCDAEYQTSGGKVSCHFVDMVEPFKAAGGDRNRANFAGDGIHPSATGQTILATGIENTMKAACLGQASGCCAAQ